MMMMRMMRMMTDFNTITHRHHLSREAAASLHHDVHGEYIAVVEKSARVL